MAPLFFAGQVLAKKSGANYDTQWVDAAQGSGGVGLSMAGKTVQPSAGQSVVAGDGAEIFNDYRSRTFADGAASAGNVASGKLAHAEGWLTTASGAAAHTEGYGTTASSGGDHAEGQSTTASGGGSHAEGISTTATGEGTHAEGCATTAGPDYCCHAEGWNTTASGVAAHAEGYFSQATGGASHAGGFHALAAALGQTAIGTCNVQSTAESDKLIIGKGIAVQETVHSRANCFRATDTGVYAAGSYRASGADYAEMFEWADGNPDGEDRAGRFVTLDGAKIRLAGPGDDYIVGVVSGNPSVVGDVHDDQWQGMYLYDVFGRPLWEDVEVPDEVDSDGRVIIPAHTEHRQKINPAYDNSQPYRPRSERPEWDAVGMLGKLVAVDDGSCEADGWCTIGEGGIAVRTESRTKYRVMERLDETHIRVLIL